jgi:integrase
MLWVGHRLLGQRRSEIG